MSSFPWRRKVAVLRASISRCTSSGSLPGGCAFSPGCTRSTSGWGSRSGSFLVASCRTRMLASGTLAFTVSWPSVKSPKMSSSPWMVARSSPACRSGTGAFCTGFPSTVRPFTDSSSPRCTSPVKSMAAGPSAVAPARCEPTSTAENVPPLIEPLIRSTTTSLGEKVASNATSWNTPCPTTSNCPLRRRALPSGFGFPRSPLTFTCASSVPPAPRSRGAIPERNARSRWRASTCPLSSPSRTDATPLRSSVRPPRSAVRFACPRKVPPPGGLRPRCNKAPSLVASTWRSALPRRLLWRATSRSWNWPERRGEAAVPLKTRRPCSRPSAGLRSWPARFATRPTSRPGTSSVNATGRPSSGSSAAGSTFACTSSIRSAPESAALASSRPMGSPLDCAPNESLTLWSRASWVWKESPRSLPEVMPSPRAETASCGASAVPVR